MDLIQTILLALIQGLTEFLPISSSAHLILPAKLLDWPDQGLAYDVAVHIGSLAAVVFYFRCDLVKITRAWLLSVAGRARFTRGDQIDVSDSNQRDMALARQGWQVIIATLPAVFIALVAKDFIALQLRSVEVIAFTTIVFGLLLGYAEIKARRQTAVVQLTFGIALSIGLAQALALIPGTSRSGITITAAILLGMSRIDAAKFSFLLSIPIILAAGILLSWELIASSQAVDWQQLTTAMLVSGVTAWLCIALFMRWVEKIGLMPFVWYRLFLGVLLIVIISAGY